MNWNNSYGDPEDYFCKRSKLSSLQQFQREISMMAAHRRLENIRKNRKQKQNKPVKLPSLYQNKKIVEHLQILQEKTTDFSQKIQKLEMEKAIQHNVNKKLIQHLQSRNQPNSLYQNRANLYPHPGPNNYLNNQSNYGSRNPYYGKTPIQTKKDYQTASIHQKINHEQKKSSDKNRQVRKGLLKKFRVAAIAVYFVIMFPKFAKLITMARYQKFCKQWYSGAKNRQIAVIRHQLYLNIENNIKQQVQFTQSKKVDKIKGKSTKQQQGKKQQFQDQTVELQLDNYMAVKFLKDSLKKIYQSFTQDQFTQQFLPLFALFGAHQFIPNYLISQYDSQFIHQNMESGYTNHTKQLTIYLIANQLYNFCFVRNQIYERVGRQIFNNTSKNNIQGFFSMVVRNAIFGNLMKEYLSSLKEQLVIEKNTKVNQKLLPIFLNQQQPNYSVAFIQQIKPDQVLTNIAYDKQVIQDITDKYLKKSRDKIFSVFNSGVISIYEKVLTASKKQKIFIKKRILLYLDSVLIKFNGIAKGKTDNNAKNYYHVKKRQEIANKDNLYTLLFQKKTQRKIQRKTQKTQKNSNQNSQLFSNKSLSSYEVSLADSNSSLLLKKRKKK